jgi:hypothetical protein
VAPAVFKTVVGSFNGSRYVRFVPSPPNFTADFDEWRLDFMHAFAKARAPLGANHLKDAIRRAQSFPPPEVARYSTSAGLQRLVVCHNLQNMVGDSPFFLIVRDAADIIGTPKQFRRASASLGGLVSDGILTEILRGTPGGRQASRFVSINLARPPRRRPRRRRWPGSNSANGRRASVAFRPTSRRLTCGRRLRVQLSCHRPVKAVRRERVGVCEFTIAGGIRRGGTNVCPDRPTVEQF